MALQRAYTQFLAAPNSDALATTASLHYITSTTSHSGSTDIIKHLNTVRNQIKKKKQDVLQTVEGQKAIAVEVDTILEFVTSGGPYLPGLDDNFLADRTVQLPVTHMVTFDDQGKISQIRQSWDQGALLKQVDVIGKSGRNWPIRDSKDQIKLITKSLAAAGDVPPPSAADAMARSRTNSTNILRDPHASLSLFGPREELENNPANAVSPYAGKRPPQRSFDDILSEEHSEETPRAVVTPYAGARPRQRSFTEILGDEEDEEPESPTRGRPSSPTKAIAPKAGADKKFQPNRLFESDGSDPVEEDAHENRSPDRFYRPHPKKFDHFELAANPEDAPQPGQPMDKVIKRAKHGSQWDFEDFVTPAKPKPLINRRAQDIRHWGNTDDDGHESPEKKPAQHKPRKDAEPHFEFVDDGEDTGQPRLVSRPRGATHNSGLGLYENKVTGEDGSADADAGDDRALGNITNLKDRRKDFDAHFMMADDSPNRAAQSSAKVSDDRKKAVKMMEANWSAYDSSPASQKENNPRKAPARTGEDRGINTQGNGMGGKKGAGRGWSIGGESDEEPTPAAPARKQGAAHKASDFWDF